MKYLNGLCLGACTIILAVCLVARADQPTTKPADDHEKTEKAEKGSKSSRWGYSPFNKLSGITEEQKQKINDIHRKFLAERKALEEKQDADVMAVLTDEQKVELEKMRADEKAKQAERRKASKDKDKEDEEKDK